MWNVVFFFSFFASVLTETYGPVNIQPGKFEYYLFDESGTVNYDFYIRCLDNPADLFFLTETQYSEFIVLRHIPPDVPKERIFYAVFNKSIKGIEMPRNSYLVFFNPVTALGEVDLMYSVVFHEKFTWVQTYWYVFLIGGIGVIFVLIVVYFLVLPRLCIMCAKNKKYKIYNCDCWGDFWSCNFCCCDRCRKRDDILEIEKGERSPLLKNEPKIIVTGVVKPKKIKELSSKKVNDWTPVLVGTLLECLDMDFEHVKTAFGVYDGSMFLNSEYFSDPMMNNVRKIFNFEKDKSEKFISFVRIAQFYNGRKMPRIFFDKKLYRKLFKAKNMDFVWGRVERERINLAYLLERTMNELQELFFGDQSTGDVGVTDSNFGKILYLHIQIYLEKTIRKEIFEYQRAIGLDKGKYRNLKTIRALISKQIEIPISRQSDGKQTPYEENASAPETSKTENMCCVCLSEPPCMLFRPCNHVCLCQSCAAKVDNVATCYICRANVDSVEKIFTS